MGTPARLTWDGEGSRLYETGVKMGVLFVKDTTTGTYGNGVAWNGLTAVTEKPTGAETTELYADDTKYLSLISLEDLEATIEAYTYPDEFAACDGSAELVAGVKIGQQDRKPFAICYRTTLGNDTALNGYGYKIHIIYGCVASPSERSYSSINESPEAITFSWDVKTTPVAFTNSANAAFKPTSYVCIDSTKVNATKLAAFEDIIYGSSTADSRLPLPDEVKTLLTASV